MDVWKIINPDDHTCDAINLDKWTKITSKARNHGFILTLNDDKL